MNGITHIQRGKYHTFFLLLKAYCSIFSDLSSYTEQVAGQEIESTIARFKMEMKKKWEDLEWILVHARWRRGSEIRARMTFGFMLSTLV